MFNKERLRQLADQARQAGNRLANQAQGAVQSAQQGLNRSKSQGPGAPGQPQLLPGVRPRWL